MPEKTQAPPQKVGKYEIRGLVGKGAMGVVYNAIDPALGRPVAIKTLSFSAIAGSPHEAELRLRFLREARSAGMLQHPNVITVHELFEENGTAYLVMELLEGASLSSLLKKKKELALGERLSIVDQIANGLSEAHAHRIVHRDLKPSNVFVLRSGVVKVLDFGVAKTGEGELTKAGTVFGTVEYMAPEQVKGAVVNQRADIFALGVVAYEVLTGRNPFRADTLAASVFKIISDNPEKISGAPFGIPAEVEQVVFRALSKSESERFESMGELRSSLQKAVESARVRMKAPVLTDEDMVITKEKGEGLSASIEPQVSQWSHVAAQADLLDEVFQRGVAAFHAGAYADCVDKMSQVLDEVPVHAMSLHYLAMSEEHLRKERLSDRERAQATALLGRMREAHRRGEPKVVIENANQLLAVDKESMEARWYRRNAEARLRAVSVGVTSGQRGGAGSRSVAGTLTRDRGKSFGYFPSGAAPERRRAVDVAPLPSATSASAGKGIWVLGGVAALFLGLVVLWLASLSGPGPKPAASADTATSLPGVRTSPFDDIDDDGAVVLQLPLPQSPEFTLDQVIPTTIVAGQTTKIGLFGKGFPPDLTVSIDGALGTILGWTFTGDGNIEIELIAPEPVDALTLVVADAQNRRRTVSLTVEAE